MHYPHRSFRRHRINSTPIDEVIRAARRVRLGDALVHASGGDRRLAEKAFAEFRAKLEKIDLR